MNENDITETLEKAAIELLNKQKDFFDFTSASHQTEWNITHHYASEIQRLFSDYSCDVDVSKPNSGNKRPDIIVHKRGGHEDNFLVVEVKRNKKDIPEDVDKIHEFWFQAPLKYKFGAVVVINKDEAPLVTVIENK